MNCRARLHADRALCRPTQKIERAHPRQVIRIDQVETSAGIHCVAKRDGRGSLGHSDFNDMLAPAGIFLKRLVLRQGVLRQNGP